MAPATASLSHEPQFLDANFSVDTDEKARTGMRGFIVCIGLIVALSPASAAEAITDGRTHYTLDVVGKLSADNQDAYLAGLIDGLRFAAGWPADRTKMVAGCMEGFPTSELRKRAFSNAERLGLRHFDSTGLAADAAIARLSWDCQLQWTVPSGTNR